MNPPLGEHAATGAGIRTSKRLAAGLCALFLVAAGCSPSQPATAPPEKQSSWGEITPIVSVKELMRDMIDPASDYIFNAVSTVLTADGVVETVPKTDEDWARIRVGAVTIAEGVHLLKVPRAFAPEGDFNDTAGPEPVELTPAQILAKVQRDPVEWNARIEALRNVGLEVLEIVKRRDVDALWGASEDLDTACENCHRSYWYPGEDQEWYEKLGRRLEEFRRRSAGKSVAR